MLTESRINYTIVSNLLHYLNIGKVSRVVYWGRKMIELVHVFFLIHALYNNTCNLYLCYNLFEPLCIIAAKIYSQFIQ